MVSKRIYQERLPIKGGLASSSQDDSAQIVSEIEVSGSYGIDESGSEFKPANDDMLFNTVSNKEAKSMWPSS